MTYLQLVNAVLKKLRESEVATVSSDDYSTLIGMFVNETKREVEDSWNWNILNQVRTITTVQDQSTYSITDGNGRMVINWFLDDNRTPLRKITGQHYYQMTPTSSERATYYTVYGTDVNKDPTILLYPTPETNGVEYTLAVKIPQDDLVDDTDELLVHNWCVILGAYSKAVRERGEDGGIATSEAEILYNKCLADAISLEGNHFQENLIWTVV